MLSKPSTFISATSFSLLSALSFSFLSFALSGALRFGFDTSLKKMEERPVTE